jgi:hypothetical protein
LQRFEAKLLVSLGILLGQASDVHNSVVTVYRQVSKSCSEPRKPHRPELHLMLTSSANSNDPKTNMIRKLKSGEYRLYSRKKNPKTGRRRNLGTFSTRAGAMKHERDVQYFKKR